MRKEGRKIMKTMNRLGKKSKFGSDFIFTSEK